MEEGDKTDDGAIEVAEEKPKDIQDPAYDSAADDQKFDLTVSVLRARNLRSYKILPPPEEEEVQTKGKKPTKVKEEEEDVPIAYSTEPPATFPSIHALLHSNNSYIVKGNLVTDKANPEYGFNKLHRLLKSERSLDFLCCTPLKIEVTEVDPPPEPSEDDDAKEPDEPDICATYTVAVDLLALLQGETNIEGWFPLVRTWPVEELSVPKKDFRPKTGATDDGKIKSVVEEQPETPPPPPEVYICIMVPEPILSEDELSKTAIVTVSVDRIDGLPTTWIDEYEKLEETNTKKRVEEADKKAKEDKKVKGAKGAGVEKKTPRGPPKNPGITNETFFFELSYQLPLTGDGEQNEISCQVDKLVMPPPQPDAAPLEPEPEVQEFETVKGKPDKAAEKKAQENAARLKKEAEDRVQAAIQKQRYSRYVPLNFSRRTFLSENAAKAFHKSVKMAVPFKIVLTRERYTPAPLAEAGAKKVKKTDDAPDAPIRKKSLMGQVIMDLRVFLKEGETGLAQEYPVKMSADTLILATEERENSLVALREEALQGKKGRNKNGEVDEEIVALEARPADFYISAKTRFTVNLQFSRPLTAIQLYPKLLPRDLIPPRQPPLLEWPSAELEFDVETTEVIRKLARQFAVSANTVGWDADAALAQKRKRLLLYSVNKSGAYYQMKEALKPAVVRIAKEIRQKEAKMKGLTDVDLDSSLSAEELPRLLTKLHAQLTDQLHLTLNKYMSQDPGQKNSRFISRDKATSTGSTNVLKVTSLGNFTPIQLKTLAMEAELCDDFESASDYHERRVKLPMAGKTPNLENWEPEDCAEHWYDFALFWSRRQNIAEAERCFKQAISIDTQHIPSLLAYGAVLMDQGDLERAEVMIRGVVLAETNHFITRAIEGLYLETNEEEALARESYAKAFELFDQLKLEKKHKTSVQQQEEEKEAFIPFKLRRGVCDVVLQELVCNKDKSMKPGGLFVCLARYLLTINCTSLVEKLLFKERAQNGESPWLYMQFASLYKAQKNSAKAQDNATAALEICPDHGQVVEAFSVLGHIAFDNGNIDQAVTMYERFQDWEPEESDPSLLYRLGQIYLEDRNYSKVKILGLQLCQVFSCCTSWLTVGLACLRMQQYPEAERALVHANYLDNTRAQVWGLLVVVCLITDRYEKASHAFQQAVNLQLEDPATYRNIGAICLEKGLLDLAKMALLRSLTLSVDPETHILLADVYWAQHLFEDQVKHYTLAFEMIEEPNMKREIGGRLCTCLLQLDREDLAQKYSEFV